MNTPWIRLVDIASISPILILLGGALLLILVESFAEKLAQKASWLLTAMTLIIAIVAAIYAPISHDPFLTDWLKEDLFARFFTIFFLLIGLGSTLLACSFFERFKASQGEYYFLLLCALLGLIFIAHAADFLILFLGLETLSISLYVLCGYMKKWEPSHEASIKYFLMGSLATAFLLYGVALIYGAIGTTNLAQLSTTYSSLSSSSELAFFSGGVAFVTLGLAFKGAIVPFHVWAPDVYDGAPTPVTAFMAVGTKVGAFAAFARLFLDVLPAFDPLWNLGVEWLAYFTLIYANFVALRQTQLRRFFAYSGISHAGFLLIPLIAGGTQAMPALFFYLVVYGLSTLGAFSVLAFLDDREEGVMLQDLKGLFHRSPFLAVVLAFCLLTLAGIPPTAGFLAKFYIFKVAIQADYLTLVIVGVLMTIISAFYYLRIITIMFSKETTEAKPVFFSWPAALVGTAASLVILALSLYPEPLFALLDRFQGVL